MQSVPILLLFAVMALVPPARAAEESADHAKEEVRGMFAVDPVYVQIDPILVPVITENGPEQLLSIIVYLEVPDAPTADHVRVRVPRLADAYMQTLYGSLDRRTVFRGSLVDVTKIKSKLTLATNRVLGEGMVKSVLIQAVTQTDVLR